MKGLSKKAGQADEVVLNYKNGTQEKIDALIHAIMQRGLRFNNVRIISGQSGYDGDVRAGMKGTALGLQDGDAIMLPGDDDDGGDSGDSGGSSGGGCGAEPMTSFTTATFTGCGWGGMTVPGPSFPGFRIPGLGTVRVPLLSLPV
jgi:hypothetical protein